MPARQARLRKFQCWNDSCSTSTRLHNQCLITISSLNVLAICGFGSATDDGAGALTKLFIYFSRMAGTDTTSTSITYLFWELSRRPDIMKKLQAELDEAMTDSRVLPDISVLQQLPYLNAFMKEGK